MNGHPIHPSASFVGLDSCQCLLAVSPLADFLHPLFANSRAFCPALPRKRFGPFPGHPRSFTPTLLREGQYHLLVAHRAAAVRLLVLLPLVAHDVRCLLATPINPFRGPFGPSSLSPLLRPLLTSAVRSGSIARPSVSIPRPTADLPR